MNRVILRLVFSLCFIALVATSLACSEATTVSTNQSTDPRDEGPSDSRPSDEYILVAGQRTFSINVGESVPLEAFLYGNNGGEAVYNQQVSYQIVEGIETGASLSSLSAYTEEDGKARVSLRSAASMGEVVVRARHESSNTIDFTVRIEPTEVGGLRVRLTHNMESVLRLQDIDVRLYRNDQMSCGEFRPLNAPPEPVLIERAPWAGEHVTFAQLSVSREYVLTAIARGDRGQIAAGGCVETVRVQANREVDQEILLQLIPLNPTGRYDVISFWDFTQALADSGAVGATIVRVLNVFQNPGLALYTELINLLRNTIGFSASLIDGFLSVTGLDTTLQNMVNDFIEGNEVLRSLRDAGRDLRDVVANLQVHSELTIGKSGSDYEFRGQDNWLGITLYWRWGCEENAPPECGAIEMVPDASGEFAQLGILSSDWNGRVVAYNQLQIDQHSVSLRYGRLIIYILNEVILPAMTDGNAHSLSEAFAYWIGCGNLASWVVPDASGRRCVTVFGQEIVCIQHSTVEGVCNTAVGTVFGFADMLIRGLEFDMGLHLGGTGKLVAISSDGFVDLIEDGTYTGYVQTSDGQGSSPFNATWSGDRISINPF